MIVLYYSDYSSKRCCFCVQVKHKPFSPEHMEPFVSISWCATTQPLTLHAKTYLNNAMTEF